MLYKHCKQLLCILCASFMLVGCSYFDVGEPGLQTSKDMQRIDVTNTVDLPSEPVDITRVTADNTEGRVQIYNLDPQPSPHYAAPAGQMNMADAAYIAPAPAVPVSGAGESPTLSAAYSADPSVQIFSLDGPPFGDAYAGSPMMQPARQEDLAANGYYDGRLVIFFGHDSTRLGTNDMKRLASVARSFNANARRGLTVEGHASVLANYQSDDQRKIVNLKISLDRAYAVSRALIQKGVPADAIRVIGWGDARPPRYTAGKSLESASRRVEISG